MKNTSRRQHPGCTAPLMGEAVMSCAICGGCFLPVLLLWCAGRLINRGARHSLLRVIWWQWSSCLFCANQGHMGRMIEERSCEGQMAADSIWMLCSQRAPGCCGVERPGTFGVSSGAFHLIQKSDSLPDYLSFEVKVSRMSAGGFDNSHLISLFHPSLFCFSCGSQDIQASSVLWFTQ